MVNGPLVSFSDHSVIIIRDVDGVNTINPVWSSVSMYPFVFSIYLAVGDSFSGFCTTVLAPCMHVHYSKARDVCMLLMK